MSTSQSKTDVLDTGSYCVDKGKDRVIVVTKDDHDAPIPEKSNVLELLTIVDDSEEQSSGPIKANGDINWSCPCMASMVSGPCGFEFRQAFACFHYSTDEPKGSNCMEQFVAMSDCFKKYPELFPADDDTKGDDEKQSNLLFPNNENESTKS